MKKITIIIIGLLSYHVAFCQSLAPEVISSSGNYFENGTVSLSWTLGEPVIETDSAGGHILTQGFQQSRYDIVVVENIEENLNISLYPNPTSQLLNLDWEIPGNAAVLIELIDMQGKKLIDKSYMENKSKKQLNLSNYPAADYFVRISSGNKLVKTFKVTKH
ncbi:MAG: T9SS type A sorting domain-containing protein [Bacteroidia bacterium]|nr:T9SS type A sorting domain-containing protein [Bacteroidia bacterium]